jgi:hypothetical protein
MKTHPKKKIILFFVFVFEASGKRIQTYSWGMS